MGHYCVVVKKQKCNCTVTRKECNKWRFFCIVHNCNYFSLFFNLYHTSSLYSVLFCWFEIILYYFYKRVINNKILIQHADKLAWLLGVWFFKHVSQCDLSALCVYCVFILTFDAHRKEESGGGTCI